jgi:hypothetical protein
VCFFIAKKERMTALVPPDIPIPAGQVDENVNENMDKENQEEEEHLPEDTPDCEEQELE